MMKFWGKETFLETKIIELIIDFIKEKNKRLWTIAMTMKTKKTTSIESIFKKVQALLTLILQVSWVFCQLWKSKPNQQSFKSRKNPTIVLKRTLRKSYLRANQKKINVLKQKSKSNQKFQRDQIVSKEAKSSSKNSIMSDQ